MSVLSEDKIKKLKKELKDRKNEIKCLKKLIQINSIITSSLDRDSVLKNIFTLTKDLMLCERISLLLVNDQKEFLKFAIISKEEEADGLDSIKLRKGEGIAGLVWQKGKSLLIADTKKDKRISRKADRATDFITKSLIAVPLIVENEIIGVIEAINPLNKMYFSSSDIEILQYLSVQAAISIYNTNLYQMAITDGLTELFIHRFFHQRLEEEILRSKRHSRMLAVVMFDIDHFKKFNDNYGHQTGDMVLKLVSSIIKNQCRTSDIPCRYGGEEISVILPETDINGGYDFAEKIRTSIEAAKIKLDNGCEICITISGGVSSTDSGIFDKDILIKNADDALYLSKNKGRNMITKQILVD